MLNPLRKNIIYKVCGYSGLLWLIIAFFLLLSLFTSSGWELMEFIVLLLMFLKVFPIILLIYILLFIIAFFTKDKFATTKPSIIADIGYVIILVIGAIAVTFAVYNAQEQALIKKHNIERQNYLKTGYRTDLKNECSMLNNTLPMIINKLGSDFTKEAFANEFAKLGSISSVQISNNEILYKNQDRHHTVSIIQNFYKGSCNLEQENCYIYLWVVRDFGECKFYFDNNKKVVPTRKTLELLNK